MGSFSIWHWLILIVMWLAFLWPIGRILTRTGHSNFLALIALIPLVNLIALWVFAYKKWPSEN